ncbi:hypothetical protein CEXT_384641 [Caerostris extrusa]|uniref:Uncharacterized protein n=1 Tax=Caerostris extrusa TaxID=172846 RepID=A0AAV4TZG3_CAEEX|nr:hypothetical protein CEXT_384641 [Caerostris extrusa]
MRCGMLPDLLMFCSRLCSTYETTSNSESHVAMKHNARTMVEKRSSPIGRRVSRLVYQNNFQIHQEFSHQHHDEYSVDSSIFQDDNTNVYRAGRKCDWFNVDSHTVTPSLACKNYLT